MYFSKYSYSQDLDSKKVLLYNTFSGAIDIVEKNIFDMILGSKWQNIPPEILSKLKERKHLFKNLESQKEYVADLVPRLLDINRKNTGVPYFYLCITYDCNLACTYCNESGLAFPGNNFQMSPAQIDNAFRFILSLSPLTDIQRKNILLYGGEPLMKNTYGTVKYVVEKAKSLDIKIDVITNGVEIKLFKDMFAKNASSFGTFIITLDGIKKIHNGRRPGANGKGSFDEVIRGIELLLDLGFPVEIQSIVDAQNIDYLPDFCDLIIKKGWDVLPNAQFFIGKTTFIKDEQTYPYYLSEDQFLKSVLNQSRKNPRINDVFKKFTGGMQITNYLYSVLERKSSLVPNLLGCRACNPGIYTFCPDGFVYPCLELLGMSQYAIGKFYPDILTDTMHLKQWREYTAPELPKCKNCNYLLLCRGGCPARNLVKNGSLKKTDCPDVKKIMHTCFYEYLSNKKI